LKKPTSKAHIRTQISKQISDYLQHGGAVNVVPIGISGREDPQKASRQIFDKPKESRTPIPEVMRAIDSRKKTAKRTSKRIKRKNIQKQIIYDDFGEAVREIWVDS
tara:strand:- start:832 stop:1149 length:318 start_codon:yes stop_codon:yes gene_type:complete